MPSFKWSVRFPGVDVQAFQTALRQAIQEAMVKAARKFLLTAVPKVKIFTGFSRGAFGHLEDLVGQARIGPGGYRVDGRRGARAKPIQGRTNRTWYYYPPGGGRVVRNSVTGKAFGTQARSIIQPGRITKATRGSKMHFKFAIDISYFEQYAGGREAFAVGRAAFEQEFRSQMQSLKIDPKDFIVRREIK